MKIDSNLWVIRSGISLGKHAFIVLTNSLLYLRPHLNSTIRPTRVQQSQIYDETPKYLTLGSVLVGTINEQPYCIYCTYVETSVDHEKQEWVYL